MVDRSDILAEGHVARDNNRFISKCIYETQSVPTKNKYAISTNSRNNKSDKSIILFFDDKVHTSLSPATAVGLWRQRF